MGMWWISGFEFSFGSDVAKFNCICILVCAVVL